MALDVYVGSLTRYYAGDWGSIADKKEQRTRRTRSSDPGKDGERMRNAVLAWREGLGRALRPHLDAPLDWSESPEAPWFTGRPGWDGFGSLVLWRPTPSSRGCRGRPRCRRSGTTIPR
jgi:hypothetical protein